MSCCGFTVSIIYKNIHPSIHPSSAYQIQGSVQGESRTGREPLAGKMTNTETWNTQVNDRGVATQKAGVNKNTKKQLNQQLKQRPWQHGTQERLNSWTVFQKYLTVHKGLLTSIMFCF